MHAEIYAVLPELVLSLAIGFGALSELFIRGERIRLIGYLCLLGLLGALVQVILSYQFGAMQVFGRTYSIDAFALFFKVIFLFQAAFGILLGLHSRSLRDTVRSEYFLLTTGLALLGSVCASSSDLFLSAASLFLLNLLASILCATGAQVRESSRAGVQYLVGSFAGVVLFLFAAILIFSHAASFNLHDVHRAITTTPPEGGVLVVSAVLLGLAICFQTAAFPFQLWITDVVGGAPASAGAVVATMTRLAGFAVGIRLFLILFSEPQMTQEAFVPLGGVPWTELFAIASGVSVLFGGLLALRQRSVRRLLGALLVFHTGVLLLGLVATDARGLSALLFALGVESICVLAAQYSIDYIGNRGPQSPSGGFPGALMAHPLEAGLLVLGIAGLIGFSPLAGGAAHFALLTAALRSGSGVLFVAVLSSLVIVAMAAVRVIFSLLSRIEPRIESGTDASLSTPSGVQAVDVSDRWALLFLATPLLGLTVFGDQLLKLAGHSLGFIFW